MATATRTDIHRPSAPEFDPQAYDCFGVYDLHPEWGDGGERMRVINALIREGWSFAGAPHGTGQCSHCGAYLRYCALMGHTATRTLLYVGETCLDNRFELTKAEFDRLRRAAKLNREQATRSERIAAWAEYNPRLADLTYPEVASEMGRFVEDVAFKFSRDGRLTERQIEAIDRAFDRWIERANKRQSEPQVPTVPAPEGKTTVSGEIVKIQDREGYWGVEWKMTVRDDRGFRVWVTVPAAIAGSVAYLDTMQSLTGRRVEFTATLTRSDRDEAFAFGKRPTKARFLH